MENLADGNAGTLHTLHVMAGLCRRDSRSHFVKTFLQSQLQLHSHPSRSQPLGQSIETAFLYARDRIRFKDDPINIERVADFQRTTECGYGDCDDKVTWLGTALLSLGVSVRFRCQSYTGETWDHVYLEFYDFGPWSWIPADPTADGHTGLIAPIGWRQTIGPIGRELIYPI